MCVYVIYTFEYKMRSNTRIESYVPFDTFFFFAFFLTTTFAI